MGHPLSNHFSLPNSFPLSPPRSFIIIRVVSYCAQKMVPLFSPLLCPIFWLTFPALLLAYLPEQPPLVHGQSGIETAISTSSSSLTLPIDPTSNGCFYCSSCPGSGSILPYAGWTVKSVIGGSGGTSSSVDGNQQPCSDRSTKCADFIPLCAHSLYQVFLRSHCAASCGHCTGEKPQLPTPPPWRPNISVISIGKRRGRRVLAPTKRKGIGSEKVKVVTPMTTKTMGTTSDTMTITTILLEATTTTSSTTTMPMPTTTMPSFVPTASTSMMTKSISGEVVNGINNSQKAMITEGLTRMSQTTMKVPEMRSMAGTMGNWSTEANATSSASSAMVETTTERAPTVGTEPSDCEDIGQNCPAMKAGCGDMGQREILGVFCRKTCGFC